MKNNSNEIATQSTNQNTTSRKFKASLLLGLGLAVAVVGLSSCDGFNKNKNNKSDQDTEAYKACTSIADYRAYMKNYGVTGKFYKDAKNVVDRYVADSTEKAQKAHSKAQAEERAEAKAEAERKEEASYKNCTTVAACDAYLKAYPQGKYVTEVRAKRAELEKKEAKEAAAKKEAAKKQIEKAVEKNTPGNDKKTGPNNNNSNTKPSKTQKTGTGNKKVNVKKN